MWFYRLILIFFKFCFLLIFKIKYKLLSTHRRGTMRNFFYDLFLIKKKSNFWPNWINPLFHKFYYASSTSGEAYRDRQLTTNFEFWVEIFCVPTCFHVRIPKPCLSVRPSICPYPEKRNHLSFVNISPTLVIDTSMERSSWVLQHGNQKIWFFFSKKFEIEFDLYFDLCWRAEINIQVGLTYMSTSGMHRRLFEGRHLVLRLFLRYSLR